MATCKSMGSRGGIRLPLSHWTAPSQAAMHAQGGPITLCLSLLPPAALTWPAVFDFHQAVDGLQEVQRQVQEGKR